MTMDGSVPDASSRSTSASVSREYVCDNCMAVVKERDVADWADGEHVLCRTCWDENF